MYLPQAEDRLSMADVLCISMLLSPSAVGCIHGNNIRLPSANVPACSSVAHTRVFGTFFFCIVFSNKFNIISALSAHRASTLPQKIDSREGLFRCKRGLVANASKVNTHCIKLQFAPMFGLFAAQYSAICR